MNRGFAFYFKNAIKSSAATIFKSKSILQVWVYCFAEFIANITIIFHPIFALAAVRQAKIVDADRKMDIPQTLKVATKSKPVWTYILSIIAEAFIFIGGTLVIALITCVLALLGFAVCWLVQGPVYIIALFCIPGVLGFFVYALIMSLIFSPTAYIIETNPDLGVYETVKICFDTMKGKGKFTVFLNYFIASLLEGYIVAFCIVGSVLIPMLINSYYMPVILVAWIIFSLVIMLLFLPMFELTKKIVQKSLFEDIVIDTVNDNKRNYGINIKKIRDPVSGTLVDLFDETETDSIPEPNSPARQRIKEKAERAKGKKDNKVEVKEQIGQKDNVEQISAKEVLPEEPANEQPVQPQPEETVNEQSAQPQPEEPANEQPARPQPEEPANEQPAQSQPEAPVNEQPAQPQSEQPQEDKSEEQTEETPKRKRAVRTKTSD